MDITSISNNVLGEASQAMDSGVYLCCIVMPPWIVSLFVSNHFCRCVLPYVYITTRVTVELKSPAMRILYSSCSLQWESGLNCRVGHSRRLAVVGPVS